LNPAFGAFQECMRLGWPDWIERIGPARHVGIEDDPRIFRCGLGSVAVDAAGRDSVFQHGLSPLELLIDALAAATSMELFCRYFINSLV